MLGQPVSAAAQALVGDGLRGDYYDGRDFTTRVLTRRDAAINFDWHHENPVLGLGPEDFSVRWTGWLVPPTTGHYVLHLTVDDGMRVWLDGRQLLNEWRGQSLSFYTVPLDLRAGQAYALRIDYCQYSWSTRALLAWERPDQPLPSSWRNLWGMMGDEPPETIPTRYLFSHNPVSATAVAPTHNILTDNILPTKLPIARSEVAAVPSRRAATGRAPARLGQRAGRWPWPRS